MVNISAVRKTENRFGFGFQKTEPKLNFKTVTSVFRNFRGFVRNRKNAVARRYRVTFCDSK